MAERCGGCDLMHLALEAPARGPPRHRPRRPRPRASSGESPGAELPESLCTPRHDVGYRTRARLAVVRPRAHQSATAEREPRGRDVASCLVLDPRLDAGSPELRELFARRARRGRGQRRPGRQGRPVLEVRWTGDLDGLVFWRLSARSRQRERGPARKFGSKAPASRLASATPGRSPSAPTAHRSSSRRAGSRRRTPRMNTELGEQCAPRVLERPTVAGRPRGRALRRVGQLHACCSARHAPSLIGRRVRRPRRRAARARTSPRAGSRRVVVEADAGRFRRP